MPKFPPLPHVYSGETLTGLGWSVIHGDVMAGLSLIADESIDCVVTSPPYFWLRDYGIDGQIGLENTVQGYVDAIANVFDEIYRVLSPKGTVFLNLGDTYYSGKGESQGKDLKSKKRRFGLRAVDRSGGLRVHPGSSCAKRRRGGV